MNSIYIYFNSRDEFLRIDTNSIVYFQADGNYTRVVTINKIQYVIQGNLLQTQKVLEVAMKERSSCFVRIGKSYIINLNFLSHICVLKQRLILSDNRTFAFQIETSRDALKKLKQFMCNISQTQKK